MKYGSPGPLVGGVTSLMSERAKGLQLAILARTWGTKKRA